MYLMNITDDHDGLANRTQTIDEENDIIDIILKLLLLSIPSTVLIISLISLTLYRTVKILTTNKHWLKKFVMNYGGVSFTITSQQKIECKI